LKSKIDLNVEAVLLRKRFGEDSFSPIDIFSFICNLNNLTVVFYPMSERISGMCIKINSNDSLIAINTALSYGRQRFTAAHELYHLFIQKNFTNVVCGKEIGAAKDEEEKNADTFASFFLAPSEALRIYIRDELDKKEIDQFITEDVVKIEQYFGMSRQATLYRLVSERYITKEFADTLKTNIITFARKMGFDDKLYTSNPDDKQYGTIGSYIDLAEKLKDRDVISIGKYEELLLDAFRSDIVYNLTNAGNEKYD